MAKKVYYFKVELYDNAHNMIEHGQIADLVKDIVDNYGIANSGTNTIDVTVVGDSLHTMLDVFEYSGERMFARASKQKPTGSVIGRNYTTSVPEQLLPGIPENERGIEIYTYLMLDYATGILSIVSAQGAPNENTLKNLFTRYGNEYEVELIPIPNLNGIETLYRMENTEISTIELTIPVPDPVILEGVFGREGVQLIQESATEDMQTSIVISSPRKRGKITYSKEGTMQVIDVIRARLNKFVKAKVKAKSVTTKARDYSFFEEKFYYPIEVASYHMENNRRVYYTADELEDIYRQNMLYSFQQVRGIILSIANRN